MEVFEGEQPTGLGSRISHESGALCGGCCSGPRAAARGAVLNSNQARVISQPFHTRASDQRHAVSCMEVCSDYFCATAINMLRARHGNSNHFEREIYRPLWISLFQSLMSYESTSSLTCLLFGVEQHRSWRASSTFFLHAQVSHHII